MLLYTTKIGTSQMKIWTRSDRIVLGTAVVIGGLLAEAILCAGTLIITQNMMNHADALTQNMMDQWSRNWFGNTLDAINVAKAVGAALIIVNVTMVALWSGRRFHRQNSPVVRRRPLAQVQGLSNLSSATQSASITLSTPKAA
jgi:hypothetical protein